MKNIAISDEKETINLYSGKILGESDIDPLERIFGRLLDKIAELERNTPTPEGTRLNILEHSHDTLWKMQVEANKIVSHRLDLNRESRIRLYKAIDKNNSVMDQIAAILAQEIRATKKCEKRLSDIEEFLGDI